MDQTLKVGSSLQHKSGEVEHLVGLVLGRTLRAKRIDEQADGDIRYWGVDRDQSPVLNRLVEFGHRCVQEQTGIPPKTSFVMVNHIAAERSPNGSGGGWHRDAYQTQYKAFSYLTDVLRPEQGAFCYLPKSNSIAVRAASLAHRLVSGANRYSDSAIDTLSKIGIERKTVLLGAGVPFFVDSSLIHRGLQITEGSRVMATVYMFPNCPDWTAALV